MSNNIIEDHGMTVNERLFHAGLTAEFDIAVASKEISEVIRVLMLVGLTEIQASETATYTLNNPAAYGY